MDKDGSKRLCYCIYREIMKKNIKKIVNQASFENSSSIQQNIIGNEFTMAKQKIFIFLDLH